MHAAVFCINLNLFNRCLGRPYNKEIQLSSLELIKACTKIWEIWYSQMWLATRHQYWISGSFLKHLFAGKPSMKSRNVGCFRLKPTALQVKSQEILKFRFVNDWITNGVMEKYCQRCVIWMITQSIGSHPQIQKFEPPSTVNPLYSEPAESLQPLLCPFCKVFSLDFLLC